MENLERLTKKELIDMIYELEEIKNLHKSFYDLEKRIKDLEKRLKEIEKKTEVPIYFSRPCACRNKLK